jgi:3'(2'), 5'-bisphosphate nucleotidase
MKESGAGVQEQDGAGMALLNGLTSIASRAAAAILAIPRPALNTRDKPDLSPVTAADEASEAVILDGLSRLLPGMPVISEESAAGRPMAESAKSFLSVDPLDGTREFVAGLDEYVVNIALIENGMPVVGVIAAPARGLIWRGRVGHGAERLALKPGDQPATARERSAIHTRPCPASGARVLVSRSHLDPATQAWVSRIPQAERRACGSALKFALLAEGRADLYPRLGPTSEWDVAAGHALLLAAGGDVRKPDGQPLRYGATDSRIAGFIAAGDCNAPLLRN